MGFDIHKKAQVIQTEVAVETHAEPVTIPHRVSELETELCRGWFSPRDELFAEAMLIQPVRFMAGLWGREDDLGGWRDSRTGEFFSYAAMRQLLDERIQELGLSEDKIRAYQTSSHSIAEDQQFGRTPFAVQMEQFRT